MANNAVIASRVLAELKGSWPDGMTHAELSKAVRASAERVSLVRAKLKRDGLVQSIESRKRGKKTVWFINWQRVDDQEELVRRSLDRFDRAIDTRKDILQVNADNVYLSTPNEQRS